MKYLRALFAALALWFTAYQKGRDSHEKESLREDLEDAKVQAQKWADRPNNVRAASSRVRKLAKTKRASDSQQKP